ncbi:GH1 family beta-glucosidase [Gillisia sp. M10.2A]|uniref:Beta-glucosidase n=1 Tax=Gillisia lutea TaxID=2909668 RepID=A0ABS9EDY1_9FLAO|nr:GH1 family beta-glucosidase [Gillisia lutea]MCF4100389.1 GH1 family beta-glucosidase [Gillisia lutea]
MSQLFTGSQEQSKIFTKSDFGTNFKWGVSTSAYQTEGSHLSYGKGASIWDAFANKKGTIYKGQTGEIACDFYQRFETDLELMHNLNIPNFRFSLSWPRLIPKGTGTRNLLGIDFYNRLIDKCLKLDIEPWVTLYHWDLPNELEKKGGWTNRDIIDWFREYADLCSRKFGDRVSNWMILNEPLVFVGAGHFLGVHAPGRRGMKNFLPAMHHAAICQAEGARIIKNNRPKVKVGTTFSCSHIEAFSNREKDVLAAKRVDALVNRLFLEASLGFSYPIKELPFLKRVEKYWQPEDDKLLSYDFDFIGLQNYTREIVKHSYFVPYIKATNVKAVKRKVPTTQMKWEVYPDSLYYMLKKFDAYSGVKNISVTENGAAFNDILKNGEINDFERTTYIQQYLQALLKAKNEGVNVNGYFIWSFTDNFEWAEGFHPRFGLVYINFKTQERIVKASGKWYKEFLS